MSDFSLEFAFAPAAVTDEEAHDAVHWITGVDVIDDSVEVAANIEAGGVFACAGDNVGAEGVDEEDAVLTAGAAAVNGYLALLQTIAS